jgi:hypothetical protein
MSDRKLSTEQLEKGTAIHELFELGNSDAMHQALHLHCDMNQCGKHGSQCKPKECAVSLFRDLIQDIENEVDNEQRRGPS